MHPLDLGAVALAGAIRRREISAEEAVTGCLQRVASHDPALGAFVQVHADAALKAARTKDRTASDAPFHGVPIAIKDLNFIRFRTTRFGSTAMPAIWSPMDDVTVSRLRKAGFVLLGKTATSELGAVPLTEPAGQPPTRNPWDPERSPGGSSGGAAAAVAAGLLPVAHGSDGGGSIRIPASFCGLVGLKATRGTIPNHLGLRDPTIIYTCGALARNVEDAGAMLSIQGKPLPEAKEGPLRIRVVRDVPLVPTHQDVAAALEQAVRLFTGEGHSIEEISAPAGTVDDFLPIWQQLFSQISIMRWGRAEPVTRWLGEGGKGLDGAFVRQRQAELTARWSPWVDGCDALLTPTVSGPPPRIGQYDAKDGERYFRDVALIGAWTAPFNITGHPALSVPAGLDRDGLPIGLQLAGPMRSDRTLLALARVIEEAMGVRSRPRVWAGRHLP
ncbi:MAG: amidase [Myxococcales bacterium]|nr:amidase [Myxococcales bacterium]